MAKPSPTPFRGLPGVSDGHRTGRNGLMAGWRDGELMREDGFDPRLSKKLLPQGVAEMEGRDARILCGWCAQVHPS